jgi:hypothetical protein
VQGVHTCSSRLFSKYPIALAHGAIVSLQRQRRSQLNSIIHKWIKPVHQRSTSVSPFMDNVAPAQTLVHPLTEGVGEMPIHGRDIFIDGVCRCWRDAYSWTRYTHRRCLEACIRGLYLRVSTRRLAQRCPSLYPLRRIVANSTTAVGPTLSLP